jgi:hypothetical protein
MYRQSVLQLPNIKHPRIRPMVLKLLRGDGWGGGYRTNGKSFWNRRSVGTQIHLKTHYVIKKNTNTWNTSICLSAAWEGGLLSIDNMHFMCSSCKIIVFSAGVVDPTERLSPADCRLGHLQQWRALPGGTRKAPTGTYLTHLGGHNVIFAIDFYDPLKFADEGNTGSLWQFSYWHRQMSENTALHTPDLSYPQI